MTILTMGFNHVTTPIDLRERLAFDETQLPTTLRQLSADARLPEVAILSTCNRMEIYCKADHIRYDDLLHWLGKQRTINIDQLSQSGYFYHDGDAVRHAMRVASGLDSMMLGEPQIFGQIKTAWQLARSAGTMGRTLEHMARHVSNTAKQVRTDTDIGRHSTSVAYEAVRLARQIFGDLRQIRVLLIGAGETIGLVARHLGELGTQHMTVVNRSAQRAQELAQQIGGTSAALTDLPRLLPDHDMLISSTHAPAPILDVQTVQAAVSRRRHAPVFIVDLAVPRDIQPQVGALDDVFLYSIDDLSNIIEENTHRRQQAAQDAESIIERGIANYRRDTDNRQSAGAVRDFRQQAQQIRDAELQRAFGQLRGGVDAEKVLTRLAHKLTNKLIHDSTRILREQHNPGSPPQTDAEGDP